MSIILFLLANTHLYGLLIALSLAGTLVVELIINRELDRIFQADTLIAILTFCLGAGISVLQITRVLETSSNYFGGGGGARESGW
ncbi:MAG: hypothetical protein HC890_18810 [Chloroflexaceae bacterium]|nr:hypothetical protein [Chloroflexaceae bacterium]